MKIAVDISQIVYGTGVSVYTQNLVKNLLAVDKQNEYLLFGGSLRRMSDLRTFTASLKGNFTARLFPIPPTLADFLWNKLHTLNIESFIGKVDVFHSSDWSQPPTRAFKVTTLHDLAPLKFAKITHPRIVAAHTTRLTRVLEEVDRIIVPSEATKIDLISLGAKETRIRVIPEGVDEIFRPRPDEDVQKTKRKYRINGEYLLSIGTGGRKNISKIIEAYERVKSKNLKLVIVGEKKGPDGNARGVFFLGSVPKPELAALYSGAQSLVYPSLYEGFGLPILEAYASGCPVVTSNVSSMPEVAGKAGVLVDPYEVDSIVEGIKKAMRGRLGLIKKGFSRVKKFSWEKAAKETLLVYQEAPRL